MACYLTLASDSSLQIFPENSIGSFRVKLPKKLYLDRKRHQIGLKFLSYPMKSHNVENGQLSIAFTDATNWDGVTTQFDTEIESGYYRGAQDVVEAINSALRSIPAAHPEKYSPLSNNLVKLDLGDVEFEYNQHTEKITINAREMADYTISLQMSKELFVKLGLGLEEDVTHSVGECCRFFELPRAGNHTVDLSLARSSIFVYTDIVEADRIVGHRLVPLLAIAPITGAHGEQCYWEPRSIEYCTPRYDVIEEIQIEVTGDTGQILRFTSGKIYLTLHVRDRFEQ